MHQQLNQVRVAPVRSGAIRIDITNPEQWSAGDIAVLRNQEAKQVRDIGSLIFETPIQHNYEAGVEVRSLLSTEQLVEIDGRLAVTDEDPHTLGTRFVRFWVDEIPIGPEDSGSHGDEEHPNPSAMTRDVNRTPVTPQRWERGSPTQEIVDRDRNRGSPDFGGGTGHCENDSHQRGHIPEGENSHHQRDTFPRTIAHHHRDSLISPEFLQKTKSLKAALCTPWNR